MPDVQRGKSGVPDRDVRRTALIDAQGLLRTVVTNLNGVVESLRMGGFDHLANGAERDLAAARTRLALVTAKRQGLRL